MTKQQQLILRLVQTSCMHETAEEIFRRAKAELPSIGIATVYRNLAQLSENGLIRRVETINEPDRFDAAAPRHEHAVCRVCGRMRNVDVQGIHEAIHKALKSEDFSYRLSIHELCPQCKAMESGGEEFLPPETQENTFIPDLTGGESADTVRTPAIS